MVEKKYINVKTNKLKLTEALKLLVKKYEVHDNAEESNMDDLKEPEEDEPMEEEKPVIGDFL